jgi:hypothetical protein
MSMLASALLLSAAAAAQTHIPATGLCNTGLTPASPLPTGCTTSTPVTPVNPESGGSSVDGNWQLATPYPSAPYNQQAPDPCKLTTFGPAWVDAPWPTWFNPDDGLSQWITPLAELAAGGWYIYRTALRIPPIRPRGAKYVLTVAGQALVDDDLAAIVIEDPAGYTPYCRLVAVPLIGSGWTAWHPFNFSVPVIPNTDAFLYFITYNDEQSGGSAAGLRVEFTSAYFTPQ